MAVLSHPPVAPPNGRTSQRRNIALVVIACAVAVLIGGLLLAGRWASGRARDWAVQSLAARFRSECELGSLRVVLFPVPYVSGTALVLRHHGRQDVPPLIVLDSFEADVGWSGLLAKRVSNVRLRGLRITVPPKGSGPKTGDQPKRTMVTVRISRIVADGAYVAVLPRKPGRPPLEFDLHELTITEAGADGPMRYQAKLTNPKPPGLIDSVGTFGPWDAEEPSATPLSGNYIFNNADLSVFKGIRGILSAKGSLNGELSRISTKGVTDTPDFAVGISGLPVHLRTEYDAVVDGTDGDTSLDPVRASFGNTVLVARGAVEHTPGNKGKTVRLDVQTVKARMEDLLRLAVKSPEPPLRGEVSFKTKFLMPPGPEDVVDKLILDGRFGAEDSHFTGPAKEKVDTLSRKGQGEPENTEIDNVAADLRGVFRLRSGSLSLSGLVFQVPGARVALDGSYALRSEELDFRGKLVLDAPVSKTTTGFKSFLLKLADPIFRKKRDTVSEVPIRISGTRKDPQFGLDIGKTLSSNGKE